MMTVICPTMAMKQTGGKMLWLSPASCSSERSLNSEEVRSSLMEKITQMQLNSDF